MSGLEKIIEQIINEAEGKAASIKKEATDKAESIIRDAGEKAASIKKEAEDQIEREVKESKSRFESSKDMQKKQAFLKAKQDTIKDCMSKAYEKIMGQDDPSYFAMLEKLLKSDLRAQDGILYLSEKDRNRMPEGFAEKIKEAAKECGGTIEISDECRNIDGGFVLAYGGIEENSSIKAIFDERADELQDQVQKILFP